MNKYTNRGRTKKNKNIEMNKYQRGGREEGGQSKKATIIELTKASPEVESVLRVCILSYSLSLSFGE